MIARSVGLLVCREQPHPVLPRLRIVGRKQRFLGQGRKSANIAAEFEVLLSAVA